MAKQASPSGGPFGGIGRVLQSRDFVIFFAGGAAHSWGFWVKRLAIGWLTWQLTESASWLGIIGFAYLFPTALLGPFAGAVGDRYGLIRVAKFFLAGNAVLILGLSVLVFLDQLNVHLLLAITILSSTISTFSIPARAALAPRLVPAEDISAAVALNATVGHAGPFVGAALFGLLILIDISVAVAVGALSSLLFLWSLMVLEVPLDKNRKKQNPVQGMIEGFRYILNHQGLVALLLTQLLMHSLLRPYLDLMPAFADQIFARGETGYAILSGAGGVGAILGGLYLSHRGRTAGLARIVVASVFSASLLLILFAFTNAFWLGVGCIFFVGLAFTTNGIGMQSLILNAGDKEMHGRLATTAGIVPIGMPAIGALLLGPLSDVIGLQITVGGAAAVTIIAMLGLSRGVARRALMLEAVRPITAE